MSTKRLIGVLSLALGLALVFLIMQALRPAPAVYALPAIPNPNAFVMAGKSPGGSGGNCTKADPCGSLQYAINRATPGVGDNIYVAQGTYTNTGTVVITITKSVTLLGGWDGASSGSIDRNPQLYISVLDGQNQRRVVYISGDITPTIDGFYITNGNASNAPVFPGDGGGIYCLDSQPVFTNNNIYNNTAYTGTAITCHGGGIYLSYCSNTQVLGNTLRNNTTGGNLSSLGGGIFSVHSDNVTISANTFISNSSTVSGGGLFLLYGDNIIVSRNIISGNTANSWGGGLSIAVENVIIDSNTFINNHNMALSIAVTPFFTVTNNIFAHNPEGGMDVVSTIPVKGVLLNNTIAQNGDGIVLVNQFPEEPIDIWLTNTLIASNTVGLQINPWCTASLQGTLWGSGAWANGVDIQNGGGSITTGTVDLHGLPNFTNPAADDYHITSSSTAINHGVSTWLKTDIDGQSRSEGCIPDIGADEIVPWLPCYHNFLSLVRK